MGKGGLKRLKGGLNKGGSSGTTIAVRPEVGSTETEKVKPE